MKAAEAFKVAKSAVLLSGDVAARGMYFLGAYLPFRSWSLTYIDGSNGQLPSLSKLADSSKFRLL